MRSLAVALLLLSACRPALPDGKPINHGPMLEALETHYGRPFNVKVMGVEPNCTWEGYPGFVDPQDGQCRGGLSVPDYGEIYLLVDGVTPYAHMLPHELVHMMFPDDDSHSTPQAWDPGGLEETGRHHAESLGPEMNKVRFVVE